ncbi:MAG: L,D-transpeptidase family protein [Sporomusa sp.]
MAEGMAVLSEQMGKLVICLMVLIVIMTLSVDVQASLSSPLHIIINIPSCTLELYQNDTLLKEYPVAIGKPANPTPIGEFTIVDKEIDPAWYPPGKDVVVPSGSDNPLGYRWLGVGGLYGIHGTNTPRSIGLPVSNGCIRMQEEDVEELFELVDYGTVVKIEYQRVKVRVSDSGQASLGIYPDIYGREKVTLATVKQTLDKAGLGSLADGVFMQNLIAAVSGRQAMLAQLDNLKINGTLRPKCAVSWQGKKQIPVIALEDSLQIAAKWNKKQQTLKQQNNIVPGDLEDNRAYVHDEYLSFLVGRQEIWNDSKNYLEMLLPVAKFEGNILPGNIQRIDSTYAIPALTVAEALGERVIWRPDNAELIVHGKTAPIKLIDEQPFITIDHVGEVYNLAVKWDEKTQVINLTYPLHPVDYSMWLDPSAEYL